MGICPTLSKSFIHELHGINPNLKAKWNRIVNRWEIWFEDTIKEPYIIVVSRDHIDKRTLDEVRHAFWFSQHIKHNATDMLNEAEYAKQKHDERNYDNFLEAGKEVAPLIQSLQDAGTSSHGNSKTMFPGIGSGTE